MIEITEKQFEAQVKDLAKLFGWKYYHTWQSIHSPAGFPDVVMVRPPRLIFAELKSEEGKVSLGQQEWLEILKQCQKLILLNHTQTLMLPEVYLWRPSQIEEIAGILR
ncbi:unnamed protein product [marine sediment metagenome]|uniref:VRR-NUC domain-containing protein n=1 Tax=marine sediment metagenome TaxID=412755 RepID=X1ENP8_9ZZZZ